MGHFSHCSLQQATLDEIPPKIKRPTTQTNKQNFRQEREKGDYSGMDATEISHQARLTSVWRRSRVETKLNIESENQLSSLKPRVYYTHNLPIHSVVYQHAIPASMEIQSESSSRETCNRGLTGRGTRTHLAEWNKLHEHGGFRVTLRQLQLTDLLPTAQHAPCCCVPTLWLMSLSLCLNYPCPHPSQAPVNKW